MRRHALASLLPAFGFAVALTLSSAAHESRAATSSSSILPDGSVRYNYGRQPSPVLTCKPHHVCDIALEGGESVLNMAIGDSTLWVIAGGQSGPSGTTPHVFVKPMQPALDTNLVITTTKRTYDIALRSADDATHSRISFFYVDEDALAKAAIAQHERLAIEAVLAGTPQVGIDKADTKYKIDGEPTLVPDKVFNDGARTFIEWKTLPNELPAVVAVSKDAASKDAASKDPAQQPVNFRVVGSTYVIDGVSPNYDLVLAASKDRHGRAERRASIRHL